MSINLYFVLWSSLNVSLLRDLLNWFKVVFPSLNTQLIITWQETYGFFVVVFVVFVVFVVSFLFLFFFFTLVLICQAKQCGTSQIDEDGLFELVRTKPGKKTSYESPSVEKKTKKKKKAEPLESLSQGKDQFEGDLS